MSRYQSFAEFYPFYLSEHSDARNRRLHFLGSCGVLAMLAAVVIGALTPWFLLLLPLIGYGFAWVGHFFVEHNRPATFKYPLYSFIGDWVMFKDILIGKVSLRSPQARP